MRRVCAAVILGALAVGTPGVEMTAAQSPQGGQAGGSDAGVLTLESYSRLAIVNVTVTDSSGKPVHGLKREDFKVTESGKPQELKSFEEFSPATEVANLRPLPKLPEHVYTNYERPTSSNVVNLLLLDGLNTQMSDQAYAKAQMVKYLKTIPPGTKIAIFTLGTRLRLLQGFTSDGEMLTAALNSKRARSLPSPLIGDEADGAMTDSLSDMVDAGAATGLAQFSAEQESFQSDLRVRLTMEAFSEIGAYVANVKGRKNLIWFSGSFPLHIFPDAASADPFAASRDYNTELRRTTDALTANQIAVYPVDARGLFNNPQMSAVNSNAGFARNPAGAAQSDMKFLERTANEHETLREIAEATGGEAFYNTNGLKEAVAKAIDEGANYYSVSYVPTNTVYDGGFRKVQVKLTVPGRYKLAYESGYYADDPSTKLGGVSTAPPGEYFQTAMQRGSPQASQVVFNVRVEPSQEPIPAGATPAGMANAKLKGPLQRYDIQYAVIGRTLSFSKLDNGMHHGSFEFVAIAYDGDGVPLVSTSQTLNADVKEETYLRLQHSPMPFHQQIDLPAGDIFLRMGVRDGTSEKLGTLEIPLVVAKVKKVAVEAGK